MPPPRLALHMDALSFSRVVTSMFKINLPTPCLLFVFLFSKKKKSPVRQDVDNWPCFLASRPIINIANSSPAIVGSPLECGSTMGNMGPRLLRPFVAKRAQWGLHTALMSRAVFDSAFGIWRKQLSPILHRRLTAT